MPPVQGTDAQPKAPPPLMLLTSQQPQPHHAPMPLYMQVAAPPVGVVGAANSSAIIEADLRRMLNITGR
jgi:hypothetical protein